MITIRNIVSTAALAAVLLSAGSSEAYTERHSNVFGPQDDIRMEPYLFRESSTKFKKSNRSRGNYNYSLLSPSISSAEDTLKIIAIRVEFQKDTSTITTGNGMFGIFRDSYGTRDDREEYFDYYRSGVYKYDNLPHDSVYFDQQLQFARDYFSEISSGKMVIEYEIFPVGKEERNAYVVPQEMIKYSPGGKKPKETWDDYYLRRTTALMKFIRDAIKVSDVGPNSPFDNIVIDSTSGENIFYEMQPDSSLRKAAFLLIHAGASYLTDGGWDGYFGADTPSDMIDAFITPSFFKYFASDDSLAFDSLNDNYGVLVTSDSTKSSFIVDEVMMLSETSNQDSLNWGTHGILINQIARQLGIPDLFSTTSGISGVGGFCIMDFAGYSTGRGFIPPYPSAWIRAYMGWDRPTIISPSNISQACKIKALNAATSLDTSMLLVPMNGNEYFLIENRQRNLSGSDSVFNYDTTESGDTTFINPYNAVRLDSNITKTYDNPDNLKRNVVQNVRNRDVGIPASGVLIWHIDENIIRDRIEHNLVNADSVYRGINLVEADGITDLGVQFTDAFYQASFDYGGGADVFPNYVLDSVNAIRKDTVDFIGPFTRPSTKSNDGGHTFISIGIKPQISHKIELTSASGCFVKNFADSTFTINIGMVNPTVSVPTGWPKQTIPSSYLEPVTVDLSSSTTLETALIDSAGRLYIWSNDTTTLYTEEKEALPIKEYTGSIIYGDTINYTAKLPKPASMPSVLSGKNLLIPCLDSALYVISSITSDTIISNQITLGKTPSTYATTFSNGYWALGTYSGEIIYGNINSASSTIKISQSPISAIAHINDSTNTIAAIDINGTIFILNENKLIDSISIQLAPLFPPFNIVTGDLNLDNNTDIIISNLKQEIWNFSFNSTSGKLFRNSDWNSGAEVLDEPNGWAGVYIADSLREDIPDNGSAPALTDIDRDGFADILIGGTNGIYLLNNRGVLIPGWPSLLDTRYWYQRRSINLSPVVAFNENKNEPVILYSTPTGENVTFYAVKITSAKIDSIHEKKSTVYFLNDAGIPDSITELTSGYVDSVLTLGDSIVYPYLTPGGYLDALSPNAKRPGWNNTTLTTGTEKQSYFPLSFGAPGETAPMISDVNNDEHCDIFAVSRTGWIYRWSIDDTVLSVNDEWAQTGADNKRSFHYSTSNQATSQYTKNSVEYFYNRPNPVRGIDETHFKYKLGKDASSVKLDIFTYTGHHILSEDQLPTNGGWNEYRISVDKFGSATYRCRLEADFDGTKVVKFWKMAVIK